MLAIAAVEIVLYTAVLNWAELTTSLNTDMFTLDINLIIGKNKKFAYKSKMQTFIMFLDFKILAIDKLINRKSLFF